MQKTLENQTLWRVSQLCNTTSKPNKPAKSGVLGISRTSFYRLLDAGKFPKPVRPLPGIVAWRQADVMAWLTSQVAG